MESSFQSNVFEGKPPKCLAVENGVEIGKYKISTEDKARFEQLNLDDIALFAELRSNMTAFTQPAKKQEAKRAWEMELFFEARKNNGRNQKNKLCGKHKKGLVEQSQSHFRNRPQHDRKYHQLIKQIASLASLVRNVAS
ncbi:hypothetical protein GQR58_002318 [Nymphon striatum]|nr:hypothetical protein GQR58_002318 [Nymphon striatum]